MDKWERTYRENKFSIKTNNPSLLVKRFTPRLKQGSKVLDLGCGNGRNAVFLAGKGHRVDAVDIADLNIKANLPAKIKENITFFKGTVLKKYKKSTYDLIICARLFQYLSPKEMRFLMESLADATVTGGALLASYTISGGIFEEAGIRVEKYSHPITFIETLLKENGFEELYICQGEKVSKHVPYKRPIECFDIIAKKR